MGSLEDDMLSVSIEGMTNCGSLVEKFGVLSFKRRVLRGVCAGVTEDALMRVVADAFGLDHIACGEVNVKVGIAGDLEASSSSEYSISSIMLSFPSNIQEPSGPGAGFWLRSRAITIALSKLADSRE